MGDGRSHLATHYVRVGNGVPVGVGYSPTGAEALQEVLGSATPRIVGDTGFNLVTDAPERTGRRRCLLARSLPVGDRLCDVGANSATLRFVEVKEIEPECNAVRFRMLLLDERWVIDDVMTPRPGGLDEICGEAAQEGALQGE